MHVDVLQFLFMFWFRFQRIHMSISAELACNTNMFYIKELNIKQSIKYIHNYEFFGTSLAFYLYKLKSVISICSSKLNGMRIARIVRVTHLCLVQFWHLSFGWMPSLKQWMVFQRTRISQRLQWLWPQNIQL